MLSNANLFVRVICVLGDRFYEIQHKAVMTEYHLSHIIQAVAT